VRCNNIGRNKGLLIGRQTVDIDRIFFDLCPYVLQFFRIFEVFTVLAFAIGTTVRSAMKALTVLLQAVRLLTVATRRVLHGSLGAANFSLKSKCILIFDGLDGCVSLTFELFRVDIEALTARTLLSAILKHGKAIAI
jgi:hypothetical protein